MSEPISIGHFTVFPARPQVRSGFVYAIRNTVTGEFYVGSTTDVERRRQQHWSDCASGRELPRLQAAWDMYGPDVWMWVDLWRVERYEEVGAYEEAYIRFLRPAYNANHCVQKRGLSRREFCRIRDRAWANLSHHGRPDDEVTSTP